MTREAIAMTSARIVASVCALFLLVPSAVAGEYRLSAGDVVELTVAGIPDMRHRATVSLDGSISLPLVGQLKVLGLPVSELRAKVQEVLPTKVLNQRGAQGADHPIVISPDEIAIAIVEYRPVYISGDVAKPGELTFRPGMTLRQAVALAGGYDIMRFRMDNPFLEAADLRTEYESQWTEYAKGQARLKRLHAELGEQAGPVGAAEAEDLKDLPLPVDLVARIGELEEKQLATRNADYEKEKVYLAAAMKQSDHKVQVLVEQQQKEQAGADADAEELGRVTQLFEKGTIPITRVSESRRAMLLSSTRLLQSVAQAAEFEKDRDEFGRKLERLDDERRLGLTRELQDTIVLLSNTRSRLQSIGDKLVYTGLVKSQLVRGAGASPELVLFRNSGDKPERSVVTEDIALMPGDVVEVALHQPASPAETGGAADPNSLGGLAEGKSGR